MGGRRRNRQPDALVQGPSEDSSDSGEKPKTNEKNCRREKMFCAHVRKAVEKLKYTRGFTKTLSKTDCEDCMKNGFNKASTEEEKASLNLYWICVRCGHQACDNELKGHMAEHFKSTGMVHLVAVNTKKMNIWCYRCDIKSTKATSLKLLDLELLKKLGFLPPPVSQQPISLPYVKKDIENENVDKLNSPANGLTKVVGLANLGNTCFFNAVLQCLSQTPFLVKILEDLQEDCARMQSPSPKCKNSNDAEEDERPLNKFTKNRAAFTPTLCETLKTMQSMKSRSTHVPNELLASFRKKTMQCMDGGQHDSHDLLRHLLDIVRNEDPRLSKKNSVKDEDSNKDAETNEEDKSDEKPPEKPENSYLLGSEPIFRGVLISTLKCLECKNSSQRTEPFLDLSLPVVMTEKRQSPVVKTKNKVFNYTPDFAVTNASNTTSIRNQFLKKNEEVKHVPESKKKLKLMLKEKGNNHQASKSNANRISEEKQSGPLESETDADVEDNVSVPEIVESGYSSEKVSALTSPVSPDDQDLSKNSINDSSASSMNGNLPQGAVNGILEFMSGFSLDLHCQSPEDDSPVFTPLPSGISDPNGPENPMMETTNEIGEDAGISPSTSLIVNSELSPEGATMSSLSSPVTSKDSPTSPLFSMTDEKTELEKNPNISGTETKSPSWDLFEFSVDENLPSEMDQIRSLLENPFRKMALADQETPEYQTPENDEDELMTTSPVEQSEPKSENGVNDTEEELPIPPVLQRHGYDVPDDDCSIQSCLNQFTALELITGSNKVHCENCTARENKGKEGSKKMVCTQNTKQYLISQVPAVLILHLKRFQSLTMGFRKVAKHVKFPFILDLSPVCTDTKKPKIYSLYGIVEHGGGLHSGHYIAYVKTRPQLPADDPRWEFLASKDSSISPENSNPSTPDFETENTVANSKIQPPAGQWYYISDSRVKEVDEAAVLQSQAYMLFYERIL